MEETLQDGSRIVELARAQGVKPIATITWCERRFPENQQKMYEIFDALREKTGICCSPVGRYSSGSSGRKRTLTSIGWTANMPPCMAAM